MIDPDTLLEHVTFLRGLARSLLKDRDRADDLTQDTLVAAMGSAPRNPGSVARWLRGIAVNLGRMDHRTRRRQKRRELERGRSGAAFDTISPAQIAARKELVRKVVDAVFDLEEPFRSVVILRFYENLPNQEIARRLGIPEATVRSRIHRALARLRGELDDAHRGDRARWAGGLAALVGLDEEEVLLHPHPPTPSAPSWQAVTTLGVTAGFAVVLVAWLSSTLSTPPPTQPDETMASSIEDPRSLPEAEPSSVETGVADSVEDAAQAAPPPSPDGPPRELAPGAIALRVVWTGGEPAAGVRSRLLPFIVLEEGRYAPQHHEMDRICDGEGTVRDDEVEPGEYAFFLDRAAGYTYVLVRPGETTELQIEIPQRLTVAGVVRDESAAPVEDAEVLFTTRFRFSDSGVVLARTDASGRFRIRDLGKNGYLGARAPGHAESEMIFVRGAESPGDRSVDLELPGAGVDVEGRIVGAAGEPVPRAAVVLEDVRGEESRAAPDGTLRMAAPPRRGRTDEAGRFRFPGLAPGRKLLLVEPENLDHEPLLKTIRLRPGPESLDLSLERSVTLTGRVVDGSELPVAGANVLVRDSATCRLRPPRILATDEAGAFHVPGLAAGDIEAEVTTGDNRGEASFGGAAGPGDRIGWTARLARGAEIHGRLVDESGEPLEGWTVVCWAPYVILDASYRRRAEELRSSPATSEYETELRRLQEGRDGTDHEGRFRIANRRDCPHRVDVFAPGQWSSRPGLQLTGVLPQTEELVIEVPESARPSAHVTGRVEESDGTPVDILQVLVEPVGAVAGRMLDHLIQKEARFRMGPFVAGEYSIRVVPLDEIARPRTRPLRVGEFRLEPDETLDLGTIRMGVPGLLRAELGGVPLPPGRAEIKVFDASDLPVTYGELTGSTFLCRDLQPGEYTLNIVGDATSGFGAAARTFEIRAGEETEVSLILDRGKAAYFSLEPAARNTLGLAVDLRVESPSGELVGRMIGEWAERYLQAGLCLSAGEYRVAVTFEGGVTLEKAVRVPQEPDGEFFIVLDP